MPGRILFVDDEPGIRLTLPTILQQHGYDVTAVASVAEAIQRLSLQPFEILIADLNIGEPGDGFTIVSAMRRVQPRCVNIILTGYPAFENALRAIRAQVDDFLVKPADVPTLVELLERKLAEPEKLCDRCNQRLSDCLRQHTDDIAHRALEHMKAHPRLAKLPLSDQQRIDHIREVIADILADLENEAPPEAGAAAIHGRRRKQQGYSLTMLVDDRRAIDMSIYDVVREKLLDLDLSSLLVDLSRLNNSLDSQLQQSLQGFIGEAPA